MDFFKQIPCLVDRHFGYLLNCFKELTCFVDNFFRGYSINFDSSYCLNYMLYGFIINMAKALMPLLETCY